MGFLPYALLGYYLANRKLSGPVCACIYAVGIACAFYMYRGTISMSAIKGGLDKDLIDYQSFASYGFAIAVFLFSWNRQFRLFDNARARKLLSVVSGASFGVYLIHMLTMELFGMVTWRGDVFLWLAAVWRDPGVFHRAGSGFAREKDSLYRENSISIKRVQREGRYDSDPM